MLWKGASLPKLRGRNREGACGHVAVAPANALRRSGRCEIMAEVPRSVARQEVPLHVAPDVDRRPGLGTCAALHEPGRDDPIIPDVPATQRRCVCVPGPPGPRGLPARRAVLSERQWAVVHSVLFAHAVPTPGAKVLESPPFCCGVALPAVLAAALPALVATAAAANARLPRAWIQGLLGRAVSEGGVPAHASVQQQARSLLPHLRILGRRVWANFTLVLCDETGVSMLRADSHPCFRRSCVVLLRDGRHHVRLIWPRARGITAYAPVLDAAEWHRLAGPAVTRRLSKVPKTTGDEGPASGAGDRAEDRAGDTTAAHGNDPIPPALWFRTFGAAERGALGHPAADPRHLPMQTAVAALGPGVGETMGSLAADGDAAPALPHAETLEEA